MKMIVLKFGGTSLSNIKSIKNIIEIVNLRTKNNRVAIVLSAIGNTTNDLEKIAVYASKKNESYKKIISKLEQRFFSIIEKFIPMKNWADTKCNVKIKLNELEDIALCLCKLNEINKKILDNILGFGEIISSIIMTDILNNNNIECKLLNSSDIIVTDDNFGDANVIFSKTNKRIQSTFANTKYNFVLPGFVSKSENNFSTTLGRGGSDFTASIIASAIKAERLEIWTDVNGIMTADPNIVKNALPISNISYDDAFELSYFGAKVIYSKSLECAAKSNIPIHIKNTFYPKQKGTIVSKDEHKQGISKIKGLSNINEISLITIYSYRKENIHKIVRNIFKLLSEINVDILLVIQASSEFNISIAIDIKNYEITKTNIKKVFKNDIKLNYIKNIEIENKLSILTLVGENMKNNIGISGKAFSSLGNNGINVRGIAQGSSERNISIVINKKDLKKGINTVHENFFLSKYKVLHLFIVGTGNVGKVLIKKIKEQKDYLIKNHHLKIKVIGIANTKYMLIDSDEIDLNKFQDLMKTKGEKTNMDLFIDKIKELNLRNSVFIDNSASEQIASYYYRIFQNSISIVTPNKIACSSKHEDYSKLKLAALNNNCNFLYETNVGAGLPIIKTIKDLVKSGDEIKEIQAVISGSLNFIFNNYKTGITFEQIVRKAKEIGYTEPNPIIDLLGLDVKRKILILARESNIKMNIEDIKEHSFLPDDKSKNLKGEDVYSYLRDNEEHFRNIRDKVLKEGKKLRYVASFKDGKAEVKLCSLDKNSSFYSLEGKDNIIVIKTQNYQEQPMIIKGAGAGSEVTAIGVFADIISIGTN